MSSKIKRSKVSDYAALSTARTFGQFRLGRNLCTLFIYCSVDIFGVHVFLPHDTLSWSVVCDCDILILS